MESAIAAYEFEVSPRFSVNNPVVSVTERAVVEAGVLLWQSAEEFDHTHVPPELAVYKKNFMLNEESETGTPLAFRIRP